MVWITGKEPPPRHLFHLVQPLPDVLGEPFLGLAERRRSACVAVGRADSRGMSVVVSRVNSCYRAGLFALVGGASAVLLDFGALL